MTVQRIFVHESADALAAESGADAIAAAIRRAGPQMADASPVPRHDGLLVPAPGGPRRLSGRALLIARMQNGGALFPEELSERAARLSGRALAMFNMRHGGGR